MNKQTFLVGAECAVKHNNKYLIIVRPEGSHASGKLSFPGGGCELIDFKINSNTLINTVKREVFEEVGFELTDQVKYITTTGFIDELSNTPVIHSLFTCTISSIQRPEVILTNEIREYQWLSTDEILSHRDTPPWLSSYVSLL